MIGIEVEYNSNIINTITVIGLFLFFILKSNLDGFGFFHMICEL
jgi:hypothetical protein